MLSGLVARNTTRSTSTIRILQRTLDQQEKNRVRAARANFFQTQHRQVSTSLPIESQITQATSRTQTASMSSSKLFKLPGLNSHKSSAPASEAPLIVRFYDFDVQAQDAHGRTQEDILAWSDTQLERSHNYIQMLFPLPEGSAFNWEAPIIDREVMLAFRSRSELRSRLRRSFERMLEFYGFTVSVKSEAQLEEEKEVERAKAEAEAAAAHEVADAGQVEPETPTTDPHAAAIVEPTIPESATGSIEAASDQPDAVKKPSDPLAAASNPSILVGYHVIRGPNWRRNSRNWAIRFDHNHLRITRILRCLRVMGLQTECDAFFTALQGVFDAPNIHISDRTMIYWHRAVTRPLYIAPDDEKSAWLKKWEEQQKEKATTAGQEKAGKKRKGDDED